MVDDIAPGATIDCQDGRLGRLETLVRDERTGLVTDLMVRIDATGEISCVPVDYVQQVTSPSLVVLGCSRDRFSSQAPGMSVSRPLGEEEIVVPLIGEDLIARKEIVAAGELQVRKLVEEQERSVSELVRYDEVVVERVPIGRRINAEPVPRQEGDTLVIPVVEEQLVCEKQRVLVEEIRVTRRQRTETRQFTGTVRRERAVLDKGDLGDRVREIGSSKGASDRGEGYDDGEHRSGHVR